MAVPFFQVWHVDAATNARTNITHCITWSNKRGLQAKQNMVSFDMGDPAPYSVYSPYLTGDPKSLKLKLDDSIEIYASYSPITGNPPSSTYLIISMT